MSEVAWVGGRDWGTWWMCWVWFLGDGFSVSMVKFGGFVGIYNCAEMLRAHSRVKC